MQAIQTRCWSTPLIIATSLVVAVSGVLMFFHLAEGQIKSMHEWLGLLFVGAIALHVLNHLKPFTRYFSDKKALAIVALVMVVAGGWIFSASSGEGGGEHPAKRLNELAQNAPLALIAQMENQNANEIIQRLESAGISVSGPEESLNDIATANQVHPFRVIDLALATSEP